jgi:pimeloyl-ACP methyl ester carboxylesterase
MSKQRVILIHGINTTGAWQEEARLVLEPHFECVIVKYPYYRRLGATKLLFEPWVFPVFAGTAATASVLGLFRPMFWWWLALAAIAVMLSFALRNLRRAKAIRNFKTMLDKTIGPGDRPHLIAHSFGTYLTGSILTTFPNVKLDNVILVGCVLPANFGWKTILADNPLAVRRVRNEVGKKDIVVRLASMVSLFTGLGGAGVSGFLDDDVVVHTVGSPHNECARCSSLVSAIVHNVSLPTFGHSDTFLGEGYAASFWLPTLWGIPASEYAEFIDLCVTAARAEDNGNLTLLALAEAELHERTWSWANGTLEAFVERHLEHRSGISGSTGKTLGLTLDKRRVDRAVRLIWIGVANAVAERSKGSSGNGRKILSLYPPFAVTRAVESTYRQ